ncbi:MAG: hypothetical protein LBN37_03145 [Bacteroidales bacterium]|jgi:hypothetical protein|nr:hypothetical protein [Bacteroidales bacterium]
MKRLSLFALCWCCLAPIAGQDIPEEQILRYDEVKTALDRTECATHTAELSNDTLLTAFAKAAGYYPELCGVTIKIRYGAIKTSMAARPVLWSVVFNKRSHRKYLILINKNAESEQARLLYDASFNASVGVMGHELAHIADYSTQSGWKIIGTGIRYLGKKYRRKMERQTDSTAIERGMGWQLYDYTYHVIHKADISEKYRQYKLTYYLTPEEISDRLLKTDR